MWGGGNWQFPAAHKHFIPIGVHPQQEGDQRCQHTIITPQQETPQSTARIQLRPPPKMDDQHLAIDNQQTSKNQHETIPKQGDKQRELASHLHGSPEHATGNATHQTRRITKQNLWNITTIPQHPNAAQSPEKQKQTKGTPLQDYYKLLPNPNERTIPSYYPNNIPNHETPLHSHG